MVDAHAAAQPARWAALSQYMRAALLVSAELNENAVGRALVRFAQLVDQTTAGAPPPDNFEPVKW
jgi:hypothetical protein